MRGKLINNYGIYSCKFIEASKKGSFTGKIAFDVKFFQNRAIKKPPIPKNVVKSIHEN